MSNIDIQISISQRCSFYILNQKVCSVFNDLKINFKFMITKDVNCLKHILLFFQLKMYKISLKYNELSSIYMPLSLHLCKKLCIRYFIIIIIANYYIKVKVNSVGTLM